MVDGEVNRALVAVGLWRSIGDRKRTLKIVESAKILFAETYPPFERMELHDQLIWARFHKVVGKEKIFAGSFDEALLELQQGKELLEELPVESDGDKAAELGDLRAELLGVFG